MRGVYNISILCIISEYALSTAETTQIEHLTNGALVTLGHYCLQRMQWTRFGKLLLTLRCLSVRPFDTALKQLFNHIIGDVIEAKWKDKTLTLLLQKWNEHILGNGNIYTNICKEYMYLLLFRSIYSFDFFLLHPLMLFTSRVIFRMFCIKKKN